MDVQFIASVSVITADPAASRQLYLDGLGLPLRPAAPDDEYHFGDTIEGCKHFGVWPLEQAAQACFGTSSWPSGRTIPQTSIEFDVESPKAVQSGIEELRGRGFDVVHDVKTEPWGQVIARVQSIEGNIVGISYTPQMHQ